MSEQKDAPSRSKAIESRRLRKEAERIESAAKLKKMESKGKDWAPDQEKKTPKELESFATTKGKARPADFIEPYYGEKFADEIEKAADYNRKAKKGDDVTGEKSPLKEDSYDRLFDTIPFKRNELSTAYYQEARRKKKGGEMVPDPMVVMGDEKGAAIEEGNDKTRREWMAGSDKEAKAQAEDYFLSNGYDLGTGGGTEGDVLEHEFGHHYARPESSFAGKGYGDLVYGDGDGNSRYHMADDSEMVNALGRLNRETFKVTGSRYEKPEDFIKLIESGETPEYLSIEGKRMINTIRDATQKHGEKGKILMREAARRIPALVKQQEEQDSRAMVRSYLETNGLV